MGSFGKNAFLYREPSRWERRDATPQAAHQGEPSGRERSRNRHWPMRRDLAVSPVAMQFHLYSILIPPRACLYDPCSHPNPTPMLPNLKVHFGRFGSFGSFSFRNAPLCAGLLTAHSDRPKVSHFPTAPCRCRPRALTRRRRFRRNVWKFFSLTPRPPSQHLRAFHPDQRPRREGSRIDSLDTIPPASVLCGLFQNPPRNSL